MLAQILEVSSCPGWGVILVQLLGNTRSHNYVARVRILITSSMVRSKIKKAILARSDPPETLFPLRMAVVDALLNFSFVYT